MLQRKRHKLIEDTVARRRVVSVRDLVWATNASPATVRRDISTLAEAGRIRRVRGGAEALYLDWPSALAAPSFDTSRVEHATAKQAIAARAAELCEPGDSVIINAGTTTACLGGFIADRGLQVLTNSLALGNYLVAHGNCRVVLPGGEVYREQSMILSPYDHDTIIDHFYASKMFLGSLAVRAQGLIEGDPIQIKSEQKLLKQADEVIVLVDGSKFRAQGSLILCPLSRIDRLITDSSAPPEALKMLERAGVEAEVVEVDKAASAA